MVEATASEDEQNLLGTNRIVSAPIQIGGLIDTDTVYPLENYEVIDNITVGSGVTLTIEAGADLKVLGDFEILVDGSLQVEGTRKQPVTFGSGDSDPASQDWKGIRISAAADDVLIEQAVIEHADWGLYFDDASSGEVRASVIRNNNYGVYVDYRATPMIGAGNLITSNWRGVGVVGDGNFANNPQPIVTGNDLYGNSNLNFYPYNLASFICYRK